MTVDWEKIVKDTTADLKANELAESMSDFLIAALPRGDQKSAAGAVALEIMELLQKRIDALEGANHVTEWFILGIIRATVKRSVSLYGGQILTAAGSPNRIAGEKFTAKLFDVVERICEEEIARSEDDMRKSGKLR